MKIDLKKEMKKISELPNIKPGDFKEGIYKADDIAIIVTRDNNLWHLSISGESPIRYTQLKWARYNFIPNEVTMAQLFPPKEEFINYHPNCFHLWEVSK